MALERLQLISDGSQVMYGMSPATGKPIACRGMTYDPLPDQSCIDDAIREARAAQPGWAARSPAERAERLGALKRALYDAADDLACTIVQETGKPRAEAVLEVLASLDYLAYYEKNLPRLLAPECRMPTNPFQACKTIYSIRKPKGTLACIFPYNFPLQIPVKAVSEAIAAGNTVLAKPSEHTPYTFLSFARLCQDTLGENIVRPVTGIARTGNLLEHAVKDNQLDGLHFTGSSRVGCALDAILRGTGIEPVLELGGNDAFVVLKDADAERAAAAAVASAFYNAGQACCSTERCYVVKDVAERFLERAGTLTKKLLIGDGMSPYASVGPLISAQQARRVQGMIDNALDSGATLYARAAASCTPTEKGNFVWPTLLTGLSQDMAVMREEVFGPVLPVMIVKDDEEALRQANDTAYGLTGSIWTKDPEKGAAYAAQLATGIAYVNDVMWAHADAGMPWSGRGKSGVGAVGGAEGLARVTDLQTIVVNDAYAFQRCGPDAWQGIGAPEKADFFDAVRKLLHGKSILRDRMPAGYFCAKYLLKR